MKDGEIMKVFKISSITQLLYCLGCVIVMICMPLYTIFFPTAFSMACLDIATTFTLVSTFNPLGLICSVLNIILYFTTELKKSKKALVWIIAAPILMIACWIFAVCSLVYHSGGV